MQFLAELNKAIEKEPDLMVRIAKSKFSGPDGKKLLLYLFQKSGFFEISADKGVEQFLSGKRSLMIEILNLLSMDPADLVVNDATSEFLETILNTDEVKLEV